MAKPEWGIKRTCLDCDSVFYDMKKTPITCPKCKAVYSEKALLKRKPLDAFEEKTEDESFIHEQYENDDFFFKDTPAELLDSLDEFEDDFEPSHLFKG